MSVRRLGTTTRREFLRASGAAAGLAAIARMPLLPATAAAVGEPAAGPAFFSTAEREILGAIVARMVDTGLPDAPTIEAIGALDVIDGACAALDPVVSEPLPLALRLVEWWPFLFELRFRRFTRLAPEEQDESLAGWMRSRLGVRRMAFLALRNLAMLGYWSREETWPLIGYRGPLLGDPASGATS